MTEILIAENDARFLMRLTSALSDEGYEVLTARDGKEALEILRQHPVELVVIDVKMPRMAAIELLCETVKLQRLVPCIVMTSYADEHQKKALQPGALWFINRSDDLDRLRRLIRKVVDKRRVCGYLTKLNLPSFLQLLAVEKKTCTVKVSRGSVSGLLYFRKGVLLDASVEGRAGEDAVYELLAWDGFEIAVQNRCRIKKRKIALELEAVLLEAMRQHGESSRNLFGTRGSGESRDEDLVAKAKERTMALEEQLESVKDVKGYMASGIMDFSGSVLASHSTTDKINLESVGAVFNDIFRAAHEAAGKIGLEACTDTVITTPKGIIVMECSGVESAAHIHFLVILEAGGNQSLVRVQLQKAVPAAVKELG